MSLPIAGGLKLDELQGPFQPKPLYNSVKLARVVCTCLDVSGCLQLSALDEFQLLTVMSGQCPGGQPDAFPGIARDRSCSSQRALNLPAWHLPACIFISESSFACAFYRAARGDAPRIFKAV